MPRSPKTVARRSSKPAVERVQGLRSTEALHHFQCGACQKWWSIGDAPPRPAWFCPWCGRENRFGPQ